LSSIILPGGYGGGRRRLLPRVDQRWVVGEPDLFIFARQTRALKSYALVRPPVAVRDVSFRTWCPASRRPWRCHSAHNINVDVVEQPPNGSCIVDVPPKEKGQFIKHLRLRGIKATGIGPDGKPFTLRQWAALLDWDFFPAERLRSAGRQSCTSGNSSWTFGRSRCAGAGEPHPGSGVAGGARIGPGHCGAGTSARGGGRQAGAACAPRELLQADACLGKLWDAYDWVGTEPPPLSVSMFLVDSGHFLITYREVRDTGDGPSRMGSQGASTGRSLGGARQCSCQCHAGRRRWRHPVRQDVCR
jgi:hypothetical protein